MRYLITYQGRLGDVIRCFPAALHLHRKGHDVWINCLPEYHDIFACIDYARPIIEASARRRHWDKHLRLAIHEGGGGSEGRWLAYRCSQMQWADFVYRPREIVGSYGRVVFTHFFDVPDYSADVCLAPFGYSQGHRYDPQRLFHWCLERWPQRLIYVLTNPEFRDRRLEREEAFAGYVVAPSLRFLPSLIRAFGEFAAINSAQAIIAAGVREHYVHFPQLGDFAHQDTAFPQISEIAIPNLNSRGRGGRLGGRVSYNRRASAPVRSKGRSASFGFAKKSADERSEVPRQR